LRRPFTRRARRSTHMMHGLEDPPVDGIGVEGMTVVPLDLA
jgi:hypothetical protein